MDSARLFLSGLAWRKPSSFSRSTAQYIHRILGQESLKDEALSTLVGLATKPRHPFGAKSLDRHLRGMGMPERDLFWSEFLRRQDDESVPYRLLSWLETYDVNKLSQEYAEVYVRVLRWFLTATDRCFRDRTTKCLYIVGRRYPELLFNAALDSLSINDPYVPERMLAAAYGTVMAIQFAPGSPDFHRVVLAPFAQRLYQQMFRRGAQHATTHILMRDYARHTIEAALLHMPDILPRRQIAYIRPQFKFGGIRRWGRSQDRDKDRASPGSPMHMDFHNYTLGALVRNRNNYDFKHSGHKQVVENIFWRIYSLGYSLDKFEKIDKDIGSWNWRSEGGNKVDRYGKKYCWIAFFELAGYRADTGKSGRDQVDQRIPEVDIDPSFPIEPPALRVIRGDFVGKDNASVAGWIKSGPTPNLRPYLRRNSVGRFRGPWILLDAFIEQQDLERNRSVLAFVKTLLINMADRERLLKCLATYSSFGNRLLSLEQTFYTFAGEIPWSDTFPMLVNEEKLELLTGRKFIERIPLAGASMADLLFFASEGSKEDKKSGYIEREREEREPFEVELVVREHCWESYHTTTTVGLNVPVLTKEIASFAKLTSRPQTFDLFDSAGRRATLCSDLGTAYGPHERLIFYRQSVLERYLQAKGLDLIWLVGGERRFKAKDTALLHHFAEKEKAYTQFSYVVERSAIL